MNRIDTRLRTRLSTTGAGLAACALFATAALTGCGTGHLSQTASQASAVNGTGGVVGDVALRNVRIEADQKGDSVRPGQTVDLLFIASNQSATVNDELAGISSPVGKVKLGGNKSLPAGGMLVVDASADQDPSSMSVIRQLRDTEDVHASTATVTLDEPISNGITYDFTFDFKEAGDITLTVPIAAPETSESPGNEQ